MFLPFNFFVSIFMLHRERYNFPRRDFSLEKDFSCRSRSSFHNKQSCVLFPFSLPPSFYYFPYITTTCIDILVSNVAYRRVSSTSCYLLFNKRSIMSKDANYCFVIFMCIIFLCIISFLCHIISSILHYIYSNVIWTSVLPIFYCQTFFFIYFTLIKLKIKLKTFPQRERAAITKWIIFR